jgi:hypothetical protein
MTKNRMVCWVGCIPKSRHPFNVLQSILDFDLVINIIYGLGYLGVMGIFHDSMMIFWMCFLYMTMLGFIVALGICLKVQWFSWFHDQSLKSKLKTW